MKANPHIRTRLTGCIGLFLVCALAVLSGCIQDRMRDLYTVVSGTVRDSDGNGIAGATVCVYGVNPKRQTLSDGFYQIAWVPLGVVQVIAEKEGYQSVIQHTTVELHQDNDGVDFTLISVELFEPEVISGRGVRLTWEESRDVGFAAYEVYRSNSAGVSRSDVLVERIENVRTTSAYDSVILDTGTLYYKVYVINKTDKAFASNEVSTEAPNQLAGTLRHDTTLTAEGSPYSITGDLTVLRGVVLTIEPGTSIVFSLTDSLSSGEDQNLCELIVEGTLTASGTSDSPVVFTSAADTGEPGNWYGIIFYNDSDDSRCLLDMVQIKYARVGVKSVLSSPRIRSSEITGCMDGVHAQSNSTMEVTQTLFKDLTGWAFTSSGSTPHFKGNKVQSCHGGVRPIGGSNPRIEGNMIQGSSTGTGVYVREASPLVTDNQITNNKCGVLCRDVDDTVTVSNNQIMDNSAENVRLEKAGIILSGNQITSSEIGVRVTGGAPEIRENFIESNTTGLILEEECQGTVKNNWIRQNKLFGIDVDDSTPTITHNEITTTSDGDILGDGIRCQNDAVAVISWNLIDSNNQHGIMCFGSNPLITYCNIQNNKGYAVLNGGVLGIAGGQEGNYLAGNNNAAEDEVDSTSGGVADGTADWDSQSTPMQYLQVDAVLDAETQIIPGAGPES